MKKNISMLLNYCVSISCLIAFFAYSSLSDDATLTVPRHINDDYLNFTPLYSNSFEPRMGFFFNPKENQIRLDIGGALDIKRWKTQYNSFAAGIEMFTMTRLRSVGRMKFPVETTDFYFGVNGSFNAKDDQISEFTRYLMEKKTIDNDWLFKNFSTRFRIGHISSHFVDGMAVGREFKKEPFVYSREFIELIVAYSYLSTRLYGGGTFVFSTIPSNVHKIIPQIGIDSERYLGRRFKIQYGLDLRLDGYDGETKPLYSLMIGILYVSSDNTGIMLSLNSYRGKSYHGMFYKDDIELGSIGIQAYFK